MIGPLSLQAPPPREMHLKPLPTALLRHERRDDTHFDWLIQPPLSTNCPAGMLWCGRVDRPWRQWVSLGTFLLTPLPPHRRRYLTYQGPVSDGRGHVTQVGRGTVQAHVWTPTRMLLTLRYPDDHGMNLSTRALCLDRLAPDRWRVTADGAIA